MCMSGLSQRARDQALICTGFYEHDHWLLYLIRGKKRGKQNLKNFVTVQFPTNYSRNSTNRHLSATSSLFLADPISYMDSSYILGSYATTTVTSTRTEKKQLV